MVVSTGSLASGSIQAQQPVIGTLESLFFSFNSAVVTKTVTAVVQTGGGMGGVDTIFSAAVPSTGGWYHPRHGIHTSAGAAALFAAGGTPILEKFVIYDNLNFSISGGDTGLVGAAPYICRAYWRK